MLADLEREVPTEPATAPTSGPTALTERLAAAPVQQRKKLLTDYLRDAVADVTRTDAAEIRDEAGFFDLGMDSLMAVELRRRIEQGVGREIPVTLVMDHPRLSDAADYLLGDVLGLAEPASAPRSAAPATTRTDEPIAIVAVSCRFPGAPNPEAFWELLRGGVDAIREVPEDRFDIDEFYDPDPDVPGKTYTRFGGFLDGIDGFDPEFFGISPREAVWIEPQQRLILETVWEGLERAGYSPAALRGSRTGVFTGVAANEYAHLLSAESIDKIEPHFITGNALNAISGRVAFALGLEGPGGSGRHRMQLGAGGGPSGLSGPAFRGLRPGAGRRGERAAEPGHDRRRVARPDAVPGRAVQDLRRRRRRLRAQRGLRGPGAQAAERRGARRRSGLRGDPRQRGQPGRCVQRADRAQRRCPAAADRRGPGARGAGRRRRRLSRGARDGHPAG